MGLPNMARKVAVAADTGNVPARLASGAGATHESHPQCGPEKNEDNNTFDYTCPFCAAAVRSIVRSGQVNHRKHCGNQFRPTWSNMAMQVKEELKVDMALLRQDISKLAEGMVASVQALRNSVRQIQQWNGYWTWRLSLKLSSTTSHSCKRGSKVSQGGLSSTRSS